MHALCPPLEQRCSGAVQTAMCIVHLSLQTASMEISFSNRSIGTRSTNPTCPVHAEREGSARPYVLPLSTAYISASLFCVSSNGPDTAVQPSESPHLPSNLTRHVSSALGIRKLSRVTPSTLNALRAFSNSQCCTRSRYSTHVKNI